MSEPTLLLLDWAHLALQSYHLRRAVVRLLGQSENITFHVDEEESSQSFLLRLHRPLTHTFVGLRQHPEAIRSELYWLEALARDTTLPVPLPIPNCHGEYVTLLQLKSAHVLPCTLLRWVDGEPFPAADSPSIETAASALGRLLATLHQHASTWDVPPDCVRPVYDGAFFHQVAANLAPGVAAGIMAPAVYATIQQTLAVSGATLDALSRTRASWGMIHNDLHPGNCLIWGSEVRPIDFSLCGFGAFLFDLSTSLGSLSVSLRQLMLDAYQAARTLPDDAIRLIEAGFIISRMSSYGFVLPNPGQHAWLARRIPQVVETICQPFLRGEHFLLTAR